MKAFQCLLLLLIVACADRAPEPTTTDVQQPPATAASEPPPMVVEEETPSTTTTAAQREEPERNIYIDGVEIANPLVIRGRARTFENNVVLRARDDRGRVIVESFTTSDGEMGRHNPYRATLFLTRDPGRRVVVEALEYSARDGAEESLVRVEKPFAVENVEARLFFPDTNCTAVKPYVRTIPKSVSMVRLLMEALIAGPAEEEKKRGAVAAFPKGSAVRSVNLRDGVATVDFNERLQNVGGACAAQMIRASVTETLRALPNVKSVKITAGGSETLALQP